MDGLNSRGKRVNKLEDKSTEIYETNWVKEKKIGKKLAKLQRIME